MTNQLKGLFFCLIALSAIFLFSPKVVLAVTITFDSFPSSISSDSFEVSATITGPDPGTNYLRIDLFEEGTTNYFGETFSGTDWYAGSDGKQYFPISINQEGTGSATLKGRLGNPSSSEYSGPGTYKMRIRRYTSSGNQTSGDEQTPLDVQINVSFATPTPTPEPEDSDDDTEDMPTPTPTSTPVLTPTPTKKPTLKPTPTLIPAPTGEILGEEATPAAEEATPTPTVLGEKTSNPVKFIPFVFIGLGSLLLLVSGGFILSPKLKMKYNHLRKSGEGEKII